MTATAEEKKLSKRGELIKRRYDACVEKRNELIRVGDQVRKYARGESPALDKIVEDDEDAMRGMVRASYPALKRLTDSIPPAITTHDPALRVKAGPSAQGDKRQMSLVGSDLISAAISKQKLKKYLRRVTHEAIIYNLSALDLYYDSEYGLPGCRWVSGRQLVWDVSSMGDESLARFIGYEFCMDIAAARELSGIPDLAANASSNRTEVEQSTYGESTISTESDDLQDRRRLIKLYLRGDDPLAQDANIEDGANVVKDVNTDDEFEGGNRILIVDPDSWEIYSNEPLDFTIDHDEFPLKVLRLNENFDSFEGEPPFKAFLRVQDGLDMLATALLTQAKNGSITLYDYDPSLPPEVIDDLLDGMTNVGVPRRQNGSPEPPIRNHPTPGVSDATITGMRAAEDIFNKVSQTEDVSASALTGVQKSGVANAIQSRSQSRLRAMADQVEEFATEVLRCWLQIALSKMSDKDVAKWVPEATVFSLEDRQTEDPFTKLPKMEKALVSHWPGGKLSAAEIRRDLVLSIEPGSMSEFAKQQKLANVRTMREKSTQALLTIAPMLPEQGMQLSWEAFIESENAYQRLEAELMDIDDPTPFLLKPEHIRPIQPPPAVDPETGAPMQTMTPDEQAQVLGQGGQAGLME